MRLASRLPIMMMYLYPEKASRSRVFRCVLVLVTYKVTRYMIISKIMYASAEDACMPICSGENLCCRPASKPYLLIKT